MATPPRQVIPGTTYSIDKRCVAQTFRLVPTKPVLKIVEYCLAKVAADTGVQLHTFTFMSNHFHLLLTDPRGVLPTFIQTLDSLISRNLNALRGWSGENFAKGYTRTPILDIETAMEKASYALANPVAANLVTRSRGWKGVTSARMVFGQRRTIRRPRGSIWRDAPENNGERKRKRKRRLSRGRKRRGGRITAPESVELVLEAFPETLTSRSPESVMEGIRDRVERRERAAEKLRLERGISVIGMKRVMALDWRDMPRRDEDMFSHVDSVAGRDRDKLAAARHRKREFETEYRMAMDEVKKGGRPVFPHGTWLMVHRYGYPCVGPP